MMVNMLVSARYGSRGSTMGHHGVAVRCSSSVSESLQVTAYGWDLVTHRVASREVVYGLLDGVLRNAITIDPRLAAYRYRMATVSGPDKANRSEAIIGFTPQTAATEDDTRS